MKIFFTLTFLLFSLIVNAGGFDSLPPGIKATAISAISPGCVVRIGNFHGSGRAWCFASSNDPLFVVDGEPFECNDLKRIDPDNIASIDILKRDKLGVIGCRPFKGDVIIITTKSIHTRKFIIKDFLTGEKIPAATIRFTSIKDTINALADENGSITTGKLKAGTTYDITVSSAGYKTFTTTVADKEQEILLEREVKLCAEVIVIAYPGFGCGRTYTSISQKVTQCNWETIPDTVWSKVAISTISIPAGNFFLYPNPVQRNGVFNLQLESKLDETIQLTVIGMSGTVVSLQSKKIRRGLNRLSVTADSKWAAGIYNIQLRNEKGTLIRQEKLVVQ